MKTSALGIKQIARREGTILHVYLDSKRLPTAGVGHLITAAEKAAYPVGKPITQAQSDAWLTADLKECEDAVNAVGVSLRQNEFDALVSLAFNIGVAGFRRSTVVRKLKAGDKKAAANAILLWNKPPEIQGRRRTEYNQFKTPYTTSTAAVQPTANNLVKIPTPPESADPLAVEQAGTEELAGEGSQTKAGTSNIEIGPDGIKAESTGTSVAQNVVIEKRKSTGFFESIWKKITGLFGANVGLDAVSEKAQQAQALGLSSDFWSRIIYIAVAASVVYLLFEAYKYWSHRKEDRERDAILARENSSEGNFVQFADTEYLQEYRNRGYKVITR